MSRRRPTLGGNRYPSEDERGCDLRSESVSCWARGWDGEQVAEVFVLVDGEQVVERAGAGHVKAAQGRVVLRDDVLRLHLGGARHHASVRLDNSLADCGLCVFHEQLGVGKGQES